MCWKPGSREGRHKSLETHTEAVAGLVHSAGTATRILAWILALGSIAFAVVNVAFELTGRFEDGLLSEYATGLTILNWFVPALKVVGAGIAVLSVAQHRRTSARLVNVLVRGAAGTLGVYSLGNIVARWSAW